MRLSFSMDLSIMRTMVLGIPSITMITSSSITISLRRCCIHMDGPSDFSSKTNYCVQQYEEIILDQSIL